MSFNEATGRTPWMRDRAALALQGAAGFNEATGRTPWMRLRPVLDAVGAALLQ